MAVIRVGIIGASPDKGWGSAVHVPAIAFLPDVALTAVCTTRMETARRSAEQFGEKLAFDDPAALVIHPQVGLFVVAVKAPDHYWLANMALEAARHVYCEWPLAVTVAQAEKMASLAAQQGVCAMLGLQARGSPLLRCLRDMIALGYVGRVVAVRMHCALPGGGARRSADGLYVVYKETGAGTLNIQGGHAIDALQFCVGPLGELSAVVVNSFPDVEVVEPARSWPGCFRPDLRLRPNRDRGGRIDCDSWRDRRRPRYFHGRVRDRGTLSVRGSRGQGFQMSELQLFGAQAPDTRLAELSVPDGYNTRIIPDGQTGRHPYPGVDCREQH